MPDMYGFQAGAQSTTQGTADDQHTPSQLTPNVLPCRIHHDGPIEALERFWAPASNPKDSVPTAFFRGRKLRGRRVAIPDGYQGVVATPTDRVLPKSPPKNQDADIEIVEPEEPVKVLETQGTFENMVVWGHEIIPASDDTFVKGVEEWIRFAETVSGLRLV
ncbi:ribonuclease H2 subunit C [Penicillium chermesinum]|nr:ribonuclease H2 subunit C [Penicillium chermesinum]